MSTVSNKALTKYKQPKMKRDASQNHVLIVVPKEKSSFTILHGAKNLFSKTKSLMLYNR